MNPEVTIPDYDVLRRIGGGAYGDVWLARSQATGVLRAAKIVWRKTFEEDRPFRREFEGIQKFEQISRGHPSQLALFHIGRNEAEGYFYYVMELADNANGTAFSPCTLRSKLDEGRLPATEVVKIGLALSEALEHLHRNGLVHRDVKPSNVIFVNGRPKLADIGLVTDASDRCSIVGTEGYLPPEGPGSPQADLFALGKVLYEAATGLDRRRFPKLPIDLRSWSDAKGVFELNEVFLKACQSDLTTRYQSAEQMHAELTLLQQGGSVRRAHLWKGRGRRARQAAFWLAAPIIAFILMTFASHLLQPSRPSSDERRSTNAVANDLLDKGKIYLDKAQGTNFAVAAVFFEQAIAADTNFALAYAYLASSYAWCSGEWNSDWVYPPKAKQLAIQALQLDPSLAPPHGVLAMCKVLLDWDWRGAELEYKRVLARDPRSASFHSSYAEFLKMDGRTREAVLEMQTADALALHKNPWIKHRLTALLIADRRFQDAVDQANFAIDIEPAALGHYSFRSRAMCAQGKFHDALDSEREMRLVAGEPKAEVERDIVSLKERITAEGPSVYWKRELDQAKSRNQGPYFEALAYAQLRETNQAITCLQTALQQTNVWLTFRVKSDWELDPVPKDPRFDDILHAMNLE